jgi:hypothetical protein
MLFRNRPRDTSQKSVSHPAETKSHAARNDIIAGAVIAAIRTNRAVSRRILNRGGAAAKQRKPIAATMTWTTLAKKG